MLERTFTYVNDDSSWRIVLPKISEEKEIIKSLLLIRKSIVRIGILYEHQSTTLMFFGSGCLLNNQLILTCAHNFDVIQWGNEKVPYSRIFVSFCDPANETLFSWSKPSSTIIEATLIRRGLTKEKLSEFDQIDSNMTDLAVLQLNTPTSHDSENAFLLLSIQLSSMPSDYYSINSKLYLIGYNGALGDPSDLNPYKYLKGFMNTTTDKLNFNHNANYRSVAIGRLIEEPSPETSYSTHSCSTLPGSSGAIILDVNGKFAGIHIGVSNSRQAKTQELFFNNETYNKFIPVVSKSFRCFVQESLIPNLHDSESAQAWKTIYAE